MLAKYIHFPVRMFILVNTFLQAQKSAYLYPNNLFQMEEKPQNIKSKNQVSKREHCFLYMLMI